MAVIPDIWRTELWHPMIVHFPIVLLIFAMLARVAARILQNHRGWVLKMNRVLLYTGTITAWSAVYTGSLADAEVVRSLCDPTVVEAHENMAYTVGWIFTAAVLLDLPNLLPSVSLTASLESWKEWLIIGLLVVGTGYLTYTAHLGAKLVYQQGAGVYHPTEQCAEFE
jgi:uncharacterized membrane protein